MKSTILTLIGLCMLTFTFYGQEEEVTKSFSVKKSDKITLEFKYPELVQIKTWDKDEVQIKSTVFINGGEDNDSFELNSQKSSNGTTITSRIRDIGKFKNDNYYVSRKTEDDGDVTISKNGQSITVGSGRGGRYDGVRISVILEIMVPKEAELSVNAQFGLVEVVDLPKAISVKAKFGGADISLSESSIESLWAATSWGQIYANLSQKMSIGGNDMPGQEMTAKIKKGNGNKSVKVDTEFGNVFLRKN